MPNPPSKVYKGVKSLPAQPPTTLTGSGGECRSQDGIVQHFSDNGGSVVTDPRVVLIFWGSAWSSSTASPSMGQAKQAIESILSAGYMSRLAQYRRIRRAKLLATHLHPENPPNPFTDDQLVGMITGLISSGAVPSSGNDIIYFGLTPEGVRSKDHLDDVGFHDYNGSFLFGWIGNDGTLTSLNSTPKVFSHELAEACSDPIPGDGIVVEDSCGNNAEISDVCNSTIQVINGVAICSYWSERDKSCVLPTHYSVRWFFGAAQKNPAKGMRAALAIPILAPLKLTDLLYAILHFSS